MTIDLLAPSGHTVAGYALIGTAAVLLLLRMLRPRRLRAVAGAFLAAGVVVGGAALVAGPRWTTLGALVAVVLAAGVAFLPARTPPIPTGAGCAVAVAATVLAAGCAWALPVPRFPVPTGPHAVGTRTEQMTFPDRVDDDGVRRTVVAQLWYPAVPGATSRPGTYLGRDGHEARIVAGALAAYAGLPAAVLDGLALARPGALPDASPAPGRFPLVVFSPGLGGVRGTSTAWAQEIASRGYVVAALDHPGDSAAVVLDDGRVVRTRVAATGDDARDEQLAIDMVRTRVRDLSDALTVLTTTGSLADHVDQGRVAAAGHSLGGGAALAVAARDPRFRAAVDLDGFPYLAGEPPLRRPALVLTHPLDPGESPGFPAAVRTALAAAPGSLHREVPGTEHLSFTDAPLWLPPVPDLVGTLGRTRPVLLVADVSAAFLDRTLRGRSVDVSARLDAVGVPAR